ncbi:UDP-N-acetylmuramoyl-L-alanyl-D-glutamate--2,6-diaminopimelate ligase [Virgibacillus sediminis]|uniref:UDP-N-acetylmuramoyl-L-alanyl-D-glutamate--2,6-diaminopimelate ligase n=1 Tax=Virgibacillus sediminis TaxID=202260 RepID=A0ABV7AAR8_9BACI
MKLMELLWSIPFYETASSLENIAVNSIEIDSRKVKAGSLFVCIEGSEKDGHHYAEEAARNGAVAILSEKRLEVGTPTIIVPDTVRALAMLAVRFYGNPTSNIPLIGVTGTNGKTTVSYLLESIFSQWHKKTAIVGTIQMKVGEDTFPVPNTTPDALFLQRAFFEMKKRGIDQAIMEVSSHALDMGRIYGCDYDIAVFTNLSQDHLDYHKNLEDYLWAKSLLFSQMGNKYEAGNPKFAVLNEDDPASRKLAKSTAQHVVTYGMKRNALVMAKHVRLTAEGTYFELVTPQGNMKIRSKLIGMFNVYNMLAACTAAIVSGVPLATIRDGLEKIQGVSGRFEPVFAGQSYSVIVDYAHTPDSLENVLQAISRFARRKIYIVVGCGGDRDRSKRPLMAKAALKYADYALFTSDNPRTEDPASILHDMTQGLEKGNYEVIIDRKQAIKTAVSLAEEEDIILIAGKGHETYQQIGHTKYEFDDRKVAKDAIRAKEK